MPKELAELLHVLVDGISLVAHERGRLHDVIAALTEPEPLSAPTEPAAPAETA